MLSTLRSSDEPFYKFFRLAILVLLALALTATLVSLVLGASRYLQTPDGVVHPRKAPKPHAVSTDDFVEKLGNDSKAVVEGAHAETPAGEGTPPEGKAGDTGNRRFAEEVEAMLKCEREFNKKIGRDVADPDPAAVEAFRAQFEKVADASPERGEPWASDVSTFACSALEEKDVTRLGKDGKLQEPLVTAINFHIQRWDEARRKLHAFEAEEKRRVERETRVEAQRVQDARAGVAAALTSASLSFAVFLAIAACLLLAAIESNLRAMQHSLALLATREVVLPVATEGGHTAAPQPSGEPIHLTEVALEDPLEVEYQIPEEAIARG